MAQSTYELIHGLESRPESRLESSLAAKVLLKLHQEEAGKSALAQHLGHKSVSGELKKQIRRLLELELIEMTLPDKPNSRLQKYRLTESGQSLIATDEQDQGYPRMKKKDRVFNFTGIFGHGLSKGQG